MKKRYRKKITFRFLICISLILSVVLSMIPDIALQVKATSDTEVSQDEDNVDEKVDKQSKEIKSQNALKTKFDINKPFTLSSLEDTGYRLVMDNAQIETKHFLLECVQAENGQVNKDDLTFGDVTTIKGGGLKDNVPKVVSNSKGQKHSYLYAHINGVRVYHIGKLYISQGETEEEYVYYTTDELIDNKTVYAILKENEQIHLSYSHEVDYIINYKFKNKNVDTDIGPNDWDLDRVFTPDRKLTSKKGEVVAVNVTIPRGYKATITATNSTGAILKQKKLGDMLKYKHPDDNINRIILTEDSPTSVSLRYSFSLEKITSDITITVDYEKIERITFNAKLWTDTIFSKDRIEVAGNQIPTNENSIITSTDNRIVWEFDGITAKSGRYWNTWEMNQLEINGQYVKVPLTTLDNFEPVTSETRLKTGTIVKVTVKSMGGENGNEHNRGRRRYKIEFTNCYEDVTISGGNMISHHHKEYTIRNLHGTTDRSFYAYNEVLDKKLWSTLEQSTVITQKAQWETTWETPIRFKRQYGFFPPTISFTNKLTEPLQVNDQIMFEPENKEPFIKYLIRTDISDDENVKGEYIEVPFKEWKASADGYYYFQGTNRVGEYANRSLKNGSIFVYIIGKPVKFALDYQNGADNAGKTAPLAKDILNVPRIQLGGEDGYNLDTNKKVVVSNKVPIDRNNRFIFDHWEVVMVKTDETHPNGYLTSETKKDENGQTIKVSQGQEEKLSIDKLTRLRDCLYFVGNENSEHSRVIFTLRAVWKKYDGVESIPYRVRYILAEVKNGQIDTSTENVIEEHFHTVNTGATLITDLYKDSDKTISDNILKVLQGYNITNKDFTENGKYDWKVYEPKTTKQIVNVNMDNNDATIYLIKGNSDINVEKVWTNPNYEENSVKVQLQQRKDDNDVWKNIEKPVTLSDSNAWKHTFTNLKTYYDINSLKAYQYRVVEIDNENNVVENGSNITLNQNIYRSDIIKNDSANDNIVNLQIKNTRLFDFTLSKVVEGDFANRTKEFIFDISMIDDTGKEIDKTFDYIGNVKQGYEQQVTKPKDAQITFTKGKAQVKLSHGQEIIIKNVPIDTNIKVSEQSESDYDVKYTLDTTDVAKVDFVLKNHSRVDVVNTKVAVPDTGLSNITNNGTAISFMLVIGGLLLFAIIYWIRLRKGFKNE